MKIFIDSIDQEIWNAIVNGPFIPKHVVDDKQVDKPWNQWTEEEKKLVQYDRTTKNILISSMNMVDFSRVSQRESAKEM